MFFIALCYSASVLSLYSSQVSREEVKKKNKTQTSGSSIPEIRSHKSQEFALAFRVLLFLFNMFKIEHHPACENPYTDLI